MLNALTAAFDAQYAAAPANGWDPARLLTLMIHPPPRRRRAGTAARQQWKTPLRLVSITARQSSGDCAARSSPKRPMPALLTRMSSPPKRRSARSITRCA